MDYLRIIERFRITGRGTVYTVEVNGNDSNIRIGTAYEDLRGNHFKIKGIEMFGGILDDSEGRTPLGLMFELLDGVEAYGPYLVEEHSKVNYIFCNNPLYPDRVDDEYRQEYQDVGLEHACALFDYEAMKQGNLTLYGEKISGLTIYRGQLMMPEMYQQFYSALEEKGIILINSPDIISDSAIEEMRLEIKAISTTQELVNAYVKANTNLWLIDHELDDFEKDSMEYNKVRAGFDAWNLLIKELEQNIVNVAEAEGLLNKTNNGLIKQLKEFMGKYGYKNATGWWVKSDK